MCATSDWERFRRFDGASQIQSCPPLQATDVRLGLDRRALEIGNRNLKGAPKTDRLHTTVGRRQRTAVQPLSRSVKINRNSPSVPARVRSTVPRTVALEFGTCKNHSEIRQLIWFLWTLRKDGDTKIKDKVLELWPRILGSIDSSTLEGKRLASNLCDWTAFVDEVNDVNRPLILAVAPYADENHHSYDLLKSIARISERQPLEAYEIWRRMLEAAHSDYPREAIQTALANLVRIGPEGVRNAKEIVSQYLKRGSEEPLKLLREVISVEESV